jgi:hypothetical protein
MKYTIHIPEGCEKIRSECFDLARAFHENIAKYPMQTPKNRMDPKVYMEWVLTEFSGRKWTIWAYRTKTGIIVKSHLQRP